MHLMRRLGFNSDTVIWGGGCWQVSTVRRSGSRSLPVIDRNSGRIYLVADDGALHTVMLAEGTDAASALTIIDLPASNKVRGGLNLFGQNLYIASGSGGCGNFVNRYCV